MGDAKLNIAFLWHYHQPYYKNARGYYHMPWVRFHATKDYLDMLLLIEEFPAVKQNINLVPSLLLQIEDYVKNGARDNIWYLSERPADQLDLDEKKAILENFFLANLPKMIKPYPRYYELYQQHKNESPYASANERVSHFSVQDFRDLQVWYNLIWIGQISRRRPPLKKLFQKERGFSEKDKAVLFQETLRIMGEIIPRHRAAWESGQIGLSTSPFYHAILPLLIDSEVARVSSPESPLPPAFQHPEDAEAQLLEGIRYFEKLFGRKPDGIWPSEGGVSEAAAQLVARQRVRWIATDEAILARSLREKFHSNRIYQPHIFHGRSRSIPVFFRDHYLSDTIGFVYNNWNETRAVEDFITRLHGIRTRICEAEGEENLKHHIVSVILDGENCWEHYPDDGRPFLRSLFRQIAQDPLLQTSTFSGFLAGGPVIPNLFELYPGSWKNSNFNIWIGSREDNRAWELMKNARDFLVEQENRGVLRDETIAEAWRQIYITQGSDWCWWYGNEHSSAHAMEFDRLFREHLMRVYDLTNGEIPAELYQTIKRTRFDRFTSVRPHHFISPRIDGMLSHFYEWSGAAVYEGGKSSRTAVRQNSRIIDRFYVGFDAGHFYFRIDFSQKPDPLYEFVVAGKTPRQLTLVFSPLRGVLEKFQVNQSPVAHDMLPPDFRMKKIFEAKVSYRDLGLNPGELFGFQLIIKQNGQEVEIFPHTQIIEIEVPDADYETREWWV